MQSFFANEGTYTVCIREIGFEWSTVAKRYYPFGPTYDGWAIDQNKNLVNFQSGL